MEDLTVTGSPESAKHQTAAKRLLRALITGNIESESGAEALDALLKHGFAGVDAVVTGGASADNGQQPDIQGMSK